MTIDGGDSIGSAHPQVALAVFQKFVDAIAGKPLGRGVVRELSRPPAVQPAGTGSEPQPTIGIFMNGPDLLVLERFGSAITLKTAAVQAAHAAIGADPDIAIAIFQHGTRAEVAQSIAHLKVGDTLRPPSVDPFIRGDPHAAVPALQKSSNEVVGQSLFGRILNQPRTDLAVCAPAFSPNPQHSVAVTEYISNSYSGQARKLVRSSLAVAIPEQVYGTDPEIAIVVLIDRFCIRIGCVRQGN